MKRIWHPYTSWEDYKAGMWRTVSGKEKAYLLQKAIIFTGNAALYGEWMLKVIDAWPIGCEHNFTDTSINRRAWVGHAACCMAINCPESVTREAWKHLNQQQQDDANAVADIAIKTWEHNEKKDKQLCLDLD